MIRTIIWVVVLVLALSFFGISLRSVVDAPQTQDNFSFILDLIRNGWNVLVHWFATLGSIVRHPGAQ